MFFYLFLHLSLYIFLLSLLHTWFFALYFYMHILIWSLTCVCRVFSPCFIWTGSWKTKFKNSYKRCLRQQLFIAFLFFYTSQFSWFPFLVHTFDCFVHFLAFKFLKEKWLSQKHLHAKIPFFLYTCFFTHLYRDSSYSKNMHICTLSVHTHWGGHWTWTRVLCCLN